MIFKNLKEKCNYYRDLTDYKLMPNGYVLVMIDGKNFSKLVKNKFEKPFDDWFISTMDKTAVHLCKNIQNCYIVYEYINVYINSQSIFKTHMTWYHWPLAAENGCGNGIPRGLWLCNVPHSIGSRQ